MCKNQIGSAYIFTLIILCIASLIFSCAVGMTNNKSEIKHSQNNNLYYIWECSTDKFCQLMNDVLEISVKQSKENSLSEVDNFKNNFEKVFGKKDFVIRISNPPHNYVTKIKYVDKTKMRNQNESLLRYEITSTTTDEFNNNKIQKDFVLQQDGTKFVRLTKSPQ